MNFENKANSDTLAQAFLAHQQLTKEEARRIAAKIVNSGDAEIVEAAMTWARSGIFSSSPSIAGKSPAELSSSYRPTQVFTILLGLRRDPNHALKMLGSFGSERTPHLRRSTDA
jgi:hypothetical protein